MKKFKFRYIIGLFILLILVFSGGNDSENNKENNNDKSNIEVSEKKVKKFTDEEYIKAISKDIKWTYPRKAVDGYVLAYNFLGDHGDHRIVINQNGGDIKWRVEKKDKVEVIGQYDGYEVSIHFPITIKDDKITVKEEEIYIEDKEYNFHLTLGEVLKKDRLKKEYILTLRNMELDSTSLKGTTLDYLTYLIFNMGRKSKGIENLLQENITWTAYIDGENDNEIDITAEEYYGQISYVLRKEKDGFVVDPNEVTISLYLYNEQVTLADWLSMYEVNKQMKKYETLERQFQSY